ncbi:hypothetical protein B0H13DRAFT_1941686 [Mycena leptocephala]|nr:hypothetical protein B0H13DRAFT_1941686 [Mycena leptocephala]
MSNPLCLGSIPANPDIAGIGVRATIYAQNLLSFGPAIWAIWDKEVTKSELDSVETQSTTILITAFAILISAMIQERTTSDGLPSFYGTVILNLSWMNNTNTFIWFLLHVHHIDEDLNKAFWPVKGLGDLEMQAIRRKKDTVDRGFAPIFKKYPVLILGSLHLPMISIIAFYNLCHLWFKRRTIIPIVIGLLILGVINIIFIVDTEVMLHANNSVLGQGNSDWTFGQTIALLLLLVPLRDLVETIMEKHDSRRRGEHTDLLRKTIQRKETTAIKDLVENGADVNVTTNIGDFASALQLASYIGEQNLVEYLLERGADVDLNGGIYDTAIQAALCGGRQEIVDLLANCLDAGKYDVDRMPLWRTSAYNVGWGLLLVPPKRIKEGSMPPEAVNKHVRMVALTRIVTTQRGWLERSRQQGDYHLFKADTSQSMITAGFPLFLKLVNLERTAVHSHLAALTCAKLLRYGEETCLWSRTSADTSRRGIPRLGLRQCAESAGTLDKH